MKEDKIINGNCWVACFDILGFKEKVSEFEKGSGCGHLDVFVDVFYQELLGELQRHGKYWPDKIFTTWFSDTFLFFTRDDSGVSFTHNSTTVTSFCQSVMSKSWPLQAAIGFGQLYADTSKNVFIGSGLIDAYRYTEKQNWIGLVVTPKANNRLQELGVDLHRRPVRFKEYDVPVKRKEFKNGICTIVEETERLFAVRIHKLPNVIRYIEHMKKEAVHKNPKDYNDRYGVKYENTLKFFKQCP
jgi:hypothetical protein